jgi:hypothetical protein
MNVKTVSHAKILKPYIRSSKQDMMNTCQNNTVTWEWKMSYKQDQQKQINITYNVPHEEET